jgi:hypothetical protein
MVRATKVSPLGDSDQQLLQQQAIDEKGPGMVLADFETLLRFIGPDGSSGRMVSRSAASMTCYP